MVDYCPQCVHEGGNSILLNSDVIIISACNFILAIQWGCVSEKSAEYCEYPLTYTHQEGGGFAALIDI